MRRRYGVSERRACRLLDQNRSTNRYTPVPADFEVRLVKRMNELATKHPRWGYRVVWTLLKAEGWDINRKRVERLWRLEGHRVPPRRTQASGKKAQGLAVNAIWNLTATLPNQIWSYDFMGSRLRNGTPFRHRQRHSQIQPRHRRRQRQVQSHPRWDPRSAPQWTPRGSRRGDSGSPDRAADPTEAPQGIAARGGNRDPLWLVRVSGDPLRGR
jgi:HTH-like domain